MTKPSKPDEKPRRAPAKAAGAKALKPAQSDEGTTKAPAPVSSEAPAQLSVWPD